MQNEMYGVGLVNALLNEEGGIYLSKWRVELLKTIPLLNNLFIIDSLSQLRWQLMVNWPQGQERPPWGALREGALVIYFNLVSRYVEDAVPYDG